MIKDIDISSDKFAPIQKGKGVLSDLADFNVIVGKNSSGKTRLFQAIENEYKGKDPTVIYIKAHELVCKDELKSSADSSLLVEKLAKISNILGVKIQAPSDLLSNIRDVIHQTNNSFQKTIKRTDIGLSKTSLSSDIKTAWAVRSILPNDLTEDIEKEGQGYQRLVIALFVKECVSFIKNNPSTGGKRNFLILFEEPEICLHSELKRALKGALIEIVKDPNFQVIISTHDPFFATEIQEEGTPSFKRYSLVRDGSVSDVKEGYVYGVEDELMHIFLFNKIKISGKLKELKDAFGDYGRKYVKDDGSENGKEEAHTLSGLIKHQIHHCENKHTVGLIENGKESDYSDKNYYTEDELNESIAMMCKILYGQKEN